MLKPKDKLRRFLKLKDEAVFKKTGIHYANKEDIADVDKMADKDIVRFFDKMKNRIKYILTIKKAIPDDVTCVWCEIYHNIIIECSNCSYGKRNGECIERNSKYSKIAIKLEKLEKGVEKDLPLYNIINKNIPLKTILKKCRI